MTTGFLIDRVALALAVLFLLSALCPKQGLAATRQQKTDYAQLEEVVLKELQETNTPGAAVAIIKDDRVIYSKAFGVASVETKAPATEDMLFRLGSTTKMFTAAALVTLADEGKIRLDAPIGSYIKDLPPTLSRITAHQLLSNTSGMRDFAAPFVSDDEAALARMVRSWKDDLFFTEPGKIYSYSSAGFWLAGFLLEEVGKRPYADKMDELIFKPLGMTRTTLRPLVAMTYPMSVGHNINAAKRPEVIRPFFNNTAMWPAGSIFSNVGDLSRFVIALMNGGKIDGKQPLAEGVAARLPAPHAPIPGDSTASYGYGLLMFDYRGERVVMHGGFSRGYGSMIQIWPKHRFAVIALTNRSGETLPRTRDKAAEVVLGLKPPVEERASVSPLTEAEMVSFAGRYFHDPSVWEVFIKDGKLVLKLDGAESELKKVGDRRFSYGDGEEIVFVAGAGGKIEHLFTGLYSAKKR